jgi:hypothetical protein
MNMLRFLVVALLTLNATCATELTVSVDLTRANLELGTSHGYDVVALKGAVTSTQVGSPGLPVLPVRVVVPQDMKVTGVTARPDTTESIAGTYRIIPAQPPITGTDDGVTADLVGPDPAVYSSSSPYPVQIAASTGQGSMFGYNVASLLVTPLQYRPALGQLVFQAPRCFVWVGA